MPFDKEKARSEYAQKLRDPRWQKMRLEVMQRDNFTCQMCCDNTRPLNVHHNFYERGKDPWDYPLWSLVTFCEDCHQTETDQRREDEGTLLEALRQCGFSYADINALYYALMSHASSFAKRPYVDERKSWVLCWVITNFGRLQPALEAQMMSERPGLQIQEPESDAEPNT